jgi:hypothetical protein
MRAPALATLAYAALALEACAHDSTGLGSGTQGVLGDPVRVPGTR